MISHTRSTHGVAHVFYELHYRLSEMQRESKHANGYFQDAQHIPCRRQSRSWYGYSVASLTMPRWVACRQQRDLWSRGLYFEARLRAGCCCPMSPCKLSGSNYARRCFSQGNACNMMWPPQQRISLKTRKGPVPLRRDRVNYMKEGSTSIMKIFKKVHDIFNF